MNAEIEKLRIAIKTSVNTSFGTPRVERMTVLVRDWRDMYENKFQKDDVNNFLAKYTPKDIFHILTTPEKLCPITPSEIANSLLSLRQKCI